MNRNKVNRHAEICDDIKDLYAKKNHDYGDSFHKTYVEEGMAMPRIRLGDKYNRFCTLTRKGKQEVSDENIRDTLIDMANYAIMTVVEMDCAEDDKQITANEFQQAAMRTASGMNYEHHGMLMNGALGLSGESGEVADIVKKATFQGHNLDKTHLAEELGDVAWYLAVAAEAIGYELDTIFKLNVEKLRQRYPEGFDKNRSVNRSANN